MKAFVAWARVARARKLCVGARPQSTYTGRVSRSENRNRQRAAFGKERQSWMQTGLQMGDEGEEWGAAAGVTMWLRREGLRLRTRMCAWEAGAGLRVGEDVGMNEALHGRQEGARTARMEAMGRDRRRLRRGGVG